MNKIRFICIAKYPFIFFHLKKCFHALSTSLFQQPSHSSIRKESMKNSPMIGKIDLATPYLEWQLPWCINSLKSEKKIVFCYQNCSDPLWEKIVLVIEIFFWNSRMKAKNLINSTICSDSERPEQFLATECFFNLFLEVSHMQ